MGVLYGRVSFDKRGDGHGVDDQLREGHELAAYEGITVAQVFRDDSISAWSSKAVRPGYDDLIALLETGTIPALIIWHPDRLLRDPSKANDFIEMGRRIRLKVYTVTSGTFDLSTPHGRRALRDSISGAAFESDHRGERVRLARQRQARTGVYGGGARRPFGFGVETGEHFRKWDKAAQEYKIIPVVDMGRTRPDEAAEIESWAIDLLSGVSLRSVIAATRARAVKTVTGADWQAETVRGILLSPRVCGHSVYEGEVIKRDAHERILSDEVQDALRDLLTDPARLDSPGTAPKWLGSLLYRCSLCGQDARMSVRRKYDLLVYVCRDRGHCIRPATETDDFVNSVVVARLARPDAVDLFTPQRSADGPDPAELRKEVQALRVRKDGLAAAFAEGEIDRAALAAGTERLNLRLTEAQAALSATVALSPLAGLVGVDDVRDAWFRAPLGRRRAALRALATVSITPPGRGRRRAAFDPAEAVRIDWRTAA
ncbi:recombinase family protein [Kitasatospora purpeofusca]|uniref:recombinase family protein n=1 Tax=Kitasatospora purpeofusca TaxID=67352 RepID=UPI0033F93D4D